MYVLPTERNSRSSSALVEGNSLRSVSRMTHVDGAESSAITPNYATDRALPTAHRNSSSRLRIASPRYLPLGLQFSQSGLWILSRDKR